MGTLTGRVTGVNGNLTKVSFQGSVRKNEVGYVIVDDKRLKGEVIRIANGEASMQIYEMSDGIKVGDPVEFTGELMSVELGPGLLTQVYDGLQNPLPDLAKQCGFFLERGVYLNPIPDRNWDFTPAVKVGDRVTAGDTIGTVPEGVFTHQIMVPFITKGEWTVKSIKEKGNYNVRDTVCVIGNDKGEEKALSMVFSLTLMNETAALPSARGFTKMSTRLMSVRYVRSAGSPSARMLEYTLFACTPNGS